MAKKRRAPVRTPNPSRPFSERIRPVLFFLFSFLLPSQLGKHFFAPFSYVAGIRIDYLAPTLYLTDIAALLLIALYAGDVFRFLRRPAVLIFLALLAFTGAFAISPPLFAYRFAKVVELIALFAVFRNGHRKYMSAIGAGLALAVLVQVPLAVMQLLRHHSIQGIWYFLGERYMTLSTPGIAKASLNGTQFLRPYGTFSHPNSMAGFFLLVYVLFLADRRITNLTLKYVIMAASTFLVFFSFSKNAILAYLVITFIYFLVEKTGCRICRWAKLAVPLFLGAVCMGASTDPESFEKRLTLLRESVLIIIGRPLTGTGLGSYLLASRLFPTKYPYFFLQPVHDIFFLWLAETGAVVSGITAYLLGRWIRPALKNRGALLAVAAVLLTGISDHYWITLQQNWLLMGAVFGIMIEA